MEIRNDRMPTIRMRETGQVLKVLPDVARQLVGSGRAELINPVTGEIQVSEAPRPVETVDLSKVETTSVEPAAERAVAPAQDSKPRKPKVKSAR